MNKLIISFVFLALVWACSGRENTGNKSESGSESTADGAMIYKKNCVLCHGIDGNLGINGSKDIKASLLSQAERVQLITHGKNAMTPFKGILSEAEIDAVAAYTMTMK